MKVLGIIPARFGSTRFPGKPLAMIHEKTMIEWVFENASRAARLDVMVIATDDARIVNLARSKNMNAVLTASDHPSGTDRCFEAFKKAEIKYDLVVNIQGDEPLIPGQMIDQLIEMFERPEVQIATLVRQFSEKEDVNDSNKVKVVMDHEQKALYFSRCPVPFGSGKVKRFKHVGMYAYRPEVLEKIVTLEPSELEKTESLEQLRWLENGLAIHCGITEFHSPSVDTPEDLEVVKHLMI